MPDVRAALAHRTAATREWLAPVTAKVEPAVALARRIVAPVTPLGRIVLGLGVGSWWFGARLGWDELLVLAGACLAIFTLSVALTLGRLGFAMEVTVSPQRVIVGGDAVGEIRVTNTHARPMLGGRVEVPVGAGVASFDTGALASGATFEEPFVVPTNRRAVIPIGPARSVKGDPLGIARREVSDGESTELYVHPLTTRLPPLSAGWLRDLEGQTTNDLSVSDVAFHTLREYVPGDDRRHIHWRTTARLGVLMVRQFVDTRRSHLGLVLSDRAADWSSEQEYELGVSVVGSLGRTAILEDQEVTALHGGDRLRSATPQLLLDSLAGVTTVEEESDLRSLVLRSMHPLRSASVVIVVVGSTVDRGAVRSACLRYDRDLNVVALRCDTELSKATRRRVGNLTLLDVGSLDQLGRVLATAGIG